jgi:hypothetical protein
MRAMVLTQQMREEESPLTQREMDAPRVGPVLSAKLTGTALKS